MTAHSFEALCIPCRGDLVGFATRSLTRSRDAAEDLVQDAYVRALTVWEQWRPAEAAQAARYARAWMFKIVTAVFLDGWRRGRRRRREQVRGRAVDTYTAEDRDVVAHGVIDELYSGRDYHDPRDEIGAGEVSDETVEALLHLVPEHRAVLVQRYLRGEADVDIAPSMPRKTEQRQVELVRKRAHQAHRAVAPKLVAYARREYGLRAELAPDVAHAEAS